MTREELLSSPEYWKAQIQNSLFQVIEDYIKEKNINKTQLATELGVTKGYVTQILNGDFDHKVSKLVELSLKCQKAPVIHFCDLKEYIVNDKAGINPNRHLRPITFEVNIDTKGVIAKPHLKKVSRIKVTKETTTNFLSYSNRTSAYNKLS
jgi:transcriptional regulator with XRE-family HTH domain